MNQAMKRAVLMAVLLVGGLAACTAGAAKESDRVALEAAIQGWTKAVNARDARSLTASMTEDVELLDARGPTSSGRDAAILSLSEAAKHGQLSATTRELAIAGDVAWHVATLTQTRRNGDVQALGQALEIWKRVNGSWQLHRRMATEAAKPEASLTRPPTNEPVLDQPKN